MYRNKSHLTSKGENAEFFLEGNRMIFIKPNMFLPFDLVVFLFRLYLTEVKAQYIRKHIRALFVIYKGNGNNVCPISGEYVPMA